MKKTNTVFMLLLCILIFFSNIITAQTMEYMDMNNWQATGPGVANWIVRNGGRDVEQTENGDPIFFISNKDYIDIVYKSTIEVATTNDDDFIGVVAGYQNPMNTTSTNFKMLLFDWKQVGQIIDNQYNGQEGMALVDVEGEIPIIGDSGTTEYHNKHEYFWARTDTGAEAAPKFDVLATNYGTSKGWNDNQIYQFEMLYTQNTIKIKIDGTTIFNQNGNFSTGKIGFYNFSQPNVKYGSVQIAPGSDLNKAPVAQGDAYGTQPETDLVVSRFDGILKNDYDPNLDTIEINLQEDVSNGELSLNSNGSFTYTPNSGYEGGDMFTYYLTDSNGNNSEVKTVTIAVMSDNQAPTDINLDKNVVAKNATEDTVVGEFITDDPDENDMHDYILTDNGGGAFKVVDNQLQINDPTILGPPSSKYTISVRSTDLMGASVDKGFYIEIAIALPDINLKNALVFNSGEIESESPADTNNDGEITVEEATETYGTLDLSENSIVELDGIEHFLNLSGLKLNDNKINDIYPLSNLFILNQLELDNNQIANLTPLQNLSSLTSLSLDNNGLSNIEDLSTLNNLETLSLSANNIKDIRPLANLDNLHNLDLSNNPIFDSNTNNAHEITSLVSGDQVWVPAGYLKDSNNFEEENLDNAYLEYELYPTTFNTTNLDKSHFTLINAPSGLSIGSVDYINNKTFKVNFNYSGLDFDHDIFNLKIKLSGSILSNDQYGIKYDSLEFHDDLPVIESLNDVETLEVIEDPNLVIGQEDGKIIPIQINGGQFVDNINIDNWSMINLPAGVSLSNINRINDNKLELILTGSSDPSQYQNDITDLKISCTAQEFIDSTSQTAINSNSITIADKTAPAGYELNINQEYISISNEKIMSFNFTKAELNSKYNYQIENQENKTTIVTGSGTIIENNQEVTNIDLSSLNDGVLTLSAYLTDQAGNKGITITDNISKDTIKPELIEVKIRSDNPNNELATVGNKIIVEFKSDQEIKKPNVIIAGNQAGVVNDGDQDLTTWKAEYILTSNDEAGKINFEIDYQDIFSNKGVVKKTTTDGSEVIFDKTSPGEYLIKFETINDFINTANQKSVNLRFIGAEVGANYYYQIENKDNSTEIVSGNGIIGDENQKIENLDLSNINDGILIVEAYLKDKTGNKGQIVVDNITKDTQKPILEEVSIRSNNENNEMAKVGDKILLKLKANEEIEKPKIMIADKKAVVLDNNDEDLSTWQAEYVMASGDPTGNVKFEIQFQDVFLNPGDNQTMTTDNSSVKFDKTGPGKYQVKFNVKENVININNEQNIDIELLNAELENKYNYIINDQNDDTKPITGNGIVNNENQKISNLNLSGLDDGQITLQVYLIDQANNKGQTVFDSINKDTKQPQIINFYPEKNMEKAETKSDLKINFDEKVNKGEGSIKIIETATEKLLEKIDINSKRIIINDKQVVINKYQDLKADTEYYINIDETAFYDQAGNNYLKGANKENWTFKTVSKPNIDINLKVKNSDSKILHAGDVITYLVEIKNIGKADLVESLITAFIPSNTNYVQGSTMINGINISDHQGKFPLTAGYNINSPESKEGIIASEDSPAVISYQVQINENAVKGTVIKNQVELNGKGSYRGEIIDGLESEVIKSIVGENFSIETEKTIKKKDSESIKRGDLLIVKTVIKNNGNKEAGGISLIEMLPEGIILDKDSIIVKKEKILNSARISNSNFETKQVHKIQNNLPYEIKEDRIIFNINEINSGQKVTVSYEIKISNEIKMGSIITSYSYLSSPEIGEIETKEEIVIDNSANLSSQIKIRDINGGNIITNDIIEYTICIENKGNNKAEDLIIINPIPEGLRYIRNSTKVNDVYIDDNQDHQSQLEEGISYQIIEAKEKVKIKYKVEVNKNAPATIINKLYYQARVKKDNQYNQISNTDQISFQLGGSPGSVKIIGKIISNYDNIPQGWYLDLYTNKNKLNRVKLEKNGEFDFGGLNINKNYKILFIHPESKVIYFQKDILSNEIKDGYQKDLGEIVINPKGVIYNSVTKKPVKNAVVTIVDEDGNIIPEDYLLKGQQNQITEADGMYQFNLDFSIVESKVYKIIVKTPSGYLKDFPSKIIKPEIKILDTLKSINQDADSSTPEFEVVDSHLPSTTIEDLKYYLKFDLSSENKRFTNNHIPIDPIYENVLEITKRAGNRQYSIGDFVSYEIKVKNNTGKEIKDINIYDKLPEGFKYVKGSSYLILEDNKREKLKPTGDKLLQWNGFNLKDKDTLTLNYTLISGSNVNKSGEYLNTAYVNKANTRISNRAECSILISEDPIFSSTTIIGKVFRDSNKNGIQDKNEQGINGVEIITNKGQKIKTDQYGRYSFVIDANSNNLLGETFILKLNKASINKKKIIIDENPKIIKLTPGVIKKVNFRVIE